MRVRSTTPYSRATGGRHARDVIVTLLRDAGCSSIGFMDNFATHELILQFEHRGRRIMMRVSAKGWAAMHLKQWPYPARCKRTRDLYEADALKQGYVALPSILRDWIKGQITAIECGVFSFDTAFMPYMLLENGQTVAERVEGMALLSSEAAEETHQRGAGGGL
jgi:hypothetical protein